MTQNWNKFDLLYNKNIFAAFSTCLHIRSSLLFEFDKICLFYHLAFNKIKIHATISNLFDDKSVNVQLNFIYVRFILKIDINNNSHGMCQNKVDIDKYKNMIFYHIIYLSSSSLKYLAASFSAKRHLKNDIRY